MQNKKSAYFFYIVATLIIVALLYALFINRNSQGSKATTQDLGAPSQTVAPTVSPSASPTPTPDWHLYQNTNYNFQLSFSDAWQGYQVSKVSDLSGISLARYDVQLKTTDKKFESSGFLANPLIIYVVYKSSWNELPKGTVNWTKLGESEKYVYAYATWGVPAKDLGQITDKEIANVIKTFKVNAS